MTFRHMQFKPIQFQSMQFQPLTIASLVETAGTFYMLQAYLQGIF